MNRRSYRIRRTLSFDIVANPHREKAMASSPEPSARYREPPFSGADFPGCDPVRIAREDIRKAMPKGEPKDWLKRGIRPLRHSGRC